MSRNYHEVVESQLINFSPVGENYDVIILIKIFVIH